MTRFFGRLVAVPIRLLADAASLVTIFDPTSLWSACWKLSRSAGDGGKLLVLMARKYGVASVRETAEKMLEETRDCQLAVTMGFIEFGYREDIESVNRWVKLAREKGYRNPELLLALELALGEFVEGYDKPQIAEQILARNDLPAEVTLRALLVRALWLLEQQRWDEAEQIADKVLCIQEQGNARIIKWAACHKRAEHACGEIHFQKARQLLSPAIFNFMVAQGWFYMGQPKEAMEYLYQAKKRGIMLERLNSDVARLGGSQEFARFCREREDE